jgi:hypothetical protein
MSTYTAVTAPTQFVEANGICFACRRGASGAGCNLFSTTASAAIWTAGCRCSAQISCVYSLKGNATDFDRRA